ncbi:MAG: double zinc ribbon domain-containing protein [Gaiellales bacterium]
MNILLVDTSTNTSPLGGIQNSLHSGYVTAAERLGVIFLIALDLALIFWTFKDARRRIDDPVIVAVCVATAALFPFVGVLIYLILRPPEYLADVRERELEIRAMERRLGADQACPYCRNPAEASFLSCPYCGTKLKNACRRCKTPLDPAWRLCPHCETPVSTTLAAPTTTSARSVASEPTRTRG